MASSDADLSTQRARLHHTLRALSGIGHGLGSAVKELRPVDAHLARVGLDVEALLARSLPGCGPLLRHWQHPERPLLEWMDATAAGLAAQQLPGGAQQLYDPGAWKHFFAAALGAGGAMARAEVADAARKLQHR